MITNNEPEIEIIFIKSLIIRYFSLNNKKKWQKATLELS